jgi:hypothetical protein
MRKIRKVIETCALCLQPRLLKDSHVIPKGVYRRTRGAQSPGVSIANGKAFLSEKQLQTKLLCAGCEDRLNKLGERYFLQNCLQTDGSFPIYEKIQANPASFVPVNQGTRYWRAREIDADYEKLAYFAASLFWRFAVAKPMLAPGVITVDFPRELESGLRDYLNGNHSAISNTAVTIHAIRRLPPHIIDLRHTFISPRELPTTEFNFSFRFYEIECLGFLFFLLFTEEPSIDLLRSNCILHHEDHPIFLSDAVRDGTVSRLTNWAQSSQPIGRLRNFRG